MLYGIEWFKLQLTPVSIFSSKSVQVKMATKYHNLSEWGPWKNAEDEESVRKGSQFTPGLLPN